jgi:hypothetical protein
MAICGLADTSRTFRGDHRQDFFAVAGKTWSPDLVASTFEPRRHPARAAKSSRNTGRLANIRSWALGGASSNRGRAEGRTHRVPTFRPSRAASPRKLTEFTSSLVRLAACFHCLRHLKNGLGGPAIARKAGVR